MKLFLNKIEPLLHHFKARNNNNLLASLEYCFVSLVSSGVPVS